MIDDFIQNLHDDAFGALSSDAGFVYVPVYQSRTPLPADSDGNPIVGATMLIEEKIQQALNGLDAKNGKSGIAVIVMLPSVKGESANSAAPAMRLHLAIRIVENRLVNESTGGTGITSSRLALHIIQVLNRRAFRGGNPLYADIANMVNEVALPGDLKVHECAFIQNVTPDTLPKVIDPSVSSAGNAITLACSTADASLYYTLDGSFPGSANAAAQAYTAPFTLDPGIYSLRFAAEKSGMQASNDLFATLTV